MSLAERFLIRFRGLMRAHGRYLIPDGLKADEKGKLVSPQNLRKTIVEEVTEDLWAAHLDGTDAIGIVPITDEGTVYFAALDIDVYPLDLTRIEGAVQSLGLPLIVCRTKSGGAHLYAFFAEPAPAPLVRERLAEWAVRLGYPGVEIFPKQTRLANDTDFGNWINMPYQSGDRSTRYALRNGEMLSPEEFLDYADELALTVNEFRSIELPDRFTEDLKGAPPCLELIAEQGESGYRNNALFSFGIYVKKRYEPDERQARLEAFNDAFMQPPLPAREVADILRSINKKNYNYKCKDQPLCNLCQREVCLKREFGVAKGGTDPGVIFGPLKKIDTEPPIWIWSIDAMSIELTTSEFLDQRAFAVRCVEVLNKAPMLVKGNVWQEIIATALASVEVIDVPEDATKEGQLLIHLQRFCTARSAGKSLDELLLGKPYTDDTLTYFVATDFLAYLQRHRITGIDERKLYGKLREYGAHHYRQNIKGKTITYWSVPRFESQTEEFTPPRRPKEEAM